MRMLLLAGILIYLALMGDYSLGEINDGLDYIWWHVSRTESVR